jgi:hypothetical protein
MRRCCCGRKATHVCGCGVVACRDHYFEHVDAEHDGKQTVLLPYPLDKEPVPSTIELRREMQLSSRLE